MIKHFAFPGRMLTVIGRAGTRVAFLPGMMTTTQRRANFEQTVLPLRQELYAQAMRLSRNERDASQVMVLDYEGELFRVRVVELAHSEEECTSEVHEFTYRALLAADYRRLLGEAGFSSVRLLGGWDGEDYDEATSRRLIAVARR